MSCLTTIHILTPILLAFLYIYFTLLLNDILQISLVLLLVFFCFFILYGLSAYSLFNHQPGYESYHSARAMQGSDIQMSVDKIGDYKENQRRLYELTLLMREDINYSKLQVLQKEYIERYQKPSFCNNCQIIKSPRSYHCQHCDRCVLRREKHCQLIRMCIGAKNMKIFMQYLFISMLLSIFMVVSLVLVAIYHQNKVQKFNQFQILLFAVFQIAMGASAILFGKQFFISYFNTLDNITETQRKLDIITKKNNPFKNQKYYDKLFQSRLDFIKLDQIADPNNWLQFNQEQQIQN